MERRGAGRRRQEPPGRRQIRRTHFRLLAKRGVRGARSPFQRLGNNRVWRRARLRPRRGRRTSPARLMDLQLCHHSLSTSACLQCPGTGPINPANKEGVRGHPAQSPTSPRFLSKYAAGIRQNPLRRKHGGRPRAPLRNDLDQPAPVAACQHRLYLRCGSPVLGEAGGRRETIRTCRWPLPPTAAGGAERIVPRDPQRRWWRNVPGAGRGRGSAAAARHRLRRSCTNPVGPYSNQSAHRRRRVREEPQDARSPPAADTLLG